MWFFWFLACCTAARPDDDGEKAIKKKVKKYSSEELRKNLEALGISIDKDMDGHKKRTKKELQTILIRELKQFEHGRMTEEISCCGIKTTTRTEGFTLPMDIPDDVKMVLADLDDFLDKEMEELECNEKREDDVKFVMDTLLDQVDGKTEKEDSTPALKALKEKGNLEKVLTQEGGDWEDKAEKKSVSDVVERTRTAYCFIHRRRWQVTRNSSRRQILQ